VAKSVGAKFRARLIALRKQRNWTQEQTAERASLSYKAYQHYEIGVRENPTLRTLEKLAKGFGVTIGELFEP